MILDRYVAKLFFPVFLVSAAMFMLLLLLLDLFSHLVRYLNNEVAAKDILIITLYYVPQSFSYALPVSLLFAVAYTLGDLYAHNELTSIFAAGIPFWRFSMPFIVIGLVASVLSFYYVDSIVIPTMRTKNELSRMHLNEQRQENRSDIVIRAKNGHLIYAVDFLDTNRQILNGVQIIEQDSEGRIIYVIRAPQAIWTSAHDQEGGYWNLITPVIYEWEDDLLRFRNYGETNEFREEPAMFLRNMVEVEELRVGDARLLIEDLKATGLPFVRTLANYYRRYSFASVSLVVVVLSISMGGRFKKNILLMSLLSSLVAAVVFYVTEMITMLLAQSGYIYPIIGAWFPVFVFIALGLLCLKTAKT